MVIMQSASSGDYCEATKEEAQEDRDR